MSSKKFLFLKVIIIGGLFLSFYFVGHHKTEAASPSFFDGKIGAWPWASRNTWKNDLYNNSIFGWQVFGADNFKIFCSQNYYSNEC